VKGADGVGLIIGGAGGLVMCVATFALVPGGKGLAFGVLFGVIGVTQIARYIRRRR
jgi:hypothetical protein